MPKKKKSKKTEEIKDTTFSLDFKNKNLIVSIKDIPHIPHSINDNKYDTNDNKHDTNDNIHNTNDNTHDTNDNTHDNTHENSNDNKHENSNVDTHENSNDNTHENSNDNTHENYNYYKDIKIALFSFISNHNEIVNIKNSIEDYLSSGISKIYIAITENLYNLYNIGNINEYKNKVVITKVKNNSTKNFIIKNATDFSKKYKYDWFIYISNCNKLKDVSINLYDNKKKYIINDDFFFINLNSTFL
jgi:hypothetical protein